MAREYTGRSTDKRSDHDFYQTPCSMVQQLLDLKRSTWPKEWEVLEPAQGQGSITRQLRHHFPCVTGYDKYQGPTYFDFFEETGRYDLVITNPPFSQVNEFLEHARIVAKSSIAFLLPLRYLHGIKRYESGVFHRLAEVNVFVRAPLLTTMSSGEQYRTGMQVYAWFIWDQKEVKPPCLHWINNQPYVKGK